MSRVEYARRFGARLRQLREMAGLSQASLARLVQVAPPRVQEHESGQHVPSVELAARYAECLGVSLAAFDDLEESEKIPDSLK